MTIARGKSPEVVFLPPLKEETHRTFILHLTWVTVILQIDFFERLGQDEVLIPAPCQAIAYKAKVAMYVVYMLGLFGAHTAYADILSSIPNKYAIKLRGANAKLNIRRLLGARERVRMSKEEGLVEFDRRVLGSKSDDDEDEDEESKDEKDSLVLDQNWQ